MNLIHKVKSCEQLQYGLNFAMRGNDKIGFAVCIPYWITLFKNKKHFVDGYRPNTRPLKGRQIIHLRFGYLRNEGWSVFGAVRHPFGKQEIING